jgi:hypothetical protein
VAHVAAHELGAAAYAIKAERAAAAQDEREAAGRLECLWQRARLPGEIRELLLDDQRPQRVVLVRVRMPTRLAPGGRHTVRSARLVAEDQRVLLITTEDEQLHRLLTHRLDPAEAVATGAVTVEGAVSELPSLIELFAFPPIDTTGAD